MRPNIVSYEGPIRVDERGTLPPGRNRTGYGEQSEGAPYLEVRLETDGDEISRITLDKSAGKPLTWQMLKADKPIPAGTHAIYLIYHSSAASEKIQLRELVLLPEA